MLPGGTSVAVFRHSAESLVQLVSESVPERVLSEVIAENLRATQGINPGKGERRSCRAEAFSAEEVVAGMR